MDPEPKPRPRKRRKRRRQVLPPGLPPGTLQAPPDAEPTVVRVVGYGPDTVEELLVASAAELGALRRRWPVLWVDVSGLGDVGVIEEIGRQFDLHRLALEDVVHLGQRPKVDVYPGFAFVVLRTVDWREGEVESEQFCLFLGEDFVITVQEWAGDPFDPVRHRLAAGRPLLRQGGPDYLAYALVDAAVDHMFPVMQAYGDLLDQLEEEVYARPSREVRGRIRAARRTLLTLRRAVWPLRDAIQALQGEHVVYVKPETRVHLRDVFDHVLHAIDLGESFRDQVGGLMDGYLSSLGYRQNQVMGLLTMVGAIFLPLSFLAGLYGMNFDREASPWNMPELGMRFGYPALLLVMGLVAAGMLLTFRRMGWFEVVGRPAPREPREGA